MMSNKSLKLYYKYNDLFDIIVKEDNLFILIKKFPSYNRISKWKISKDTNNGILIESDNVFNSDRIKNDYINELIDSNNHNTENKKYKISINYKSYSYTKQSALYKILKIIKIIYPNE